MFVLALNNKKVKDLDPMLSDLVHSIFYSIQENDIIKCWRNHYDQKTDILIKIGKAIRGVSIKMGDKNSVHVEHIDKFVEFLENNGVKKENINSYLRYHYADGTVDNSGKNRLSADEYKKLHSREIFNINKDLNSPNLIRKAVERFVVKGNNSHYEIDALIHGTPESFLWISKKEIYEILSNNSNINCGSPHFGYLICQTKGRCLNNNPKYENDRNYVQIKWYSIFDDIIMYRNKKSMSGMFDFQDDNVDA